MADSEEYLYEVASRLDGEVWETIFLMLQTRAGNACEARTEDCLAGPRGDLSSLTRDRVSIHHRMPRKAGGTRDARLNTLSRLMLVCGTGTTGCHHWIEQHRIIGRDRGWRARAPRQAPPRGRCGPGPRRPLWWRAAGW